MDIIWGKNPEIKKRKKCRRYNLKELKTIEHQGILVLTTKQITEEYDAEE